MTNAIKTITGDPAQGMTPYGAPVVGTAEELSRLLERALNTLEPTQRPPWATDLADRLRPIDGGRKAPQRFILHLMGY